MRSPSARPSALLVRHDQAVAAAEFAGVAQLTMADLPVCGALLRLQLEQLLFECGRLQQLNTRPSRPKSGVQRRQRSSLLRLDKPLHAVARPWHAMETPTAPRGDPLRRLRLEVETAARR